MENSLSLGSGMSSIDAHLILYGVLAALALGTLQTYKNIAGHSLSWALSAATFATLYGLTDEFHQSFVPGRSASALDVLWDGMAALAAAMILGYLISNWAKVWGRLSQAAQLRLTREMNINRVAPQEPGLGVELDEGDCERVRVQL